MYLPARVPQDRLVIKILMVADFLPGYVFASAATAQMQSLSKFVSVKLLKIKTKSDDPVCLSQSRTMASAATATQPQGAPTDARHLSGLAKTPWGQHVGPLCVHSLHLSAALRKFLQLHTVAG